MIANNSKWDKLGVELKEFMKANINEDNSYKKPVSRLLKEFSEMHQNTTYGSTVYYYYNDVKYQIEDELRNGALKPPAQTPIINDIEVAEVEEEKDEVASLINYIESKTEYRVSTQSEEMIRDMINDYGAIETLIAIFKTIDNMDNLDIFNVIVRESRNNI